MTLREHVEGVAVLGLHPDDERRAGEGVDAEEEDGQGQDLADAPSGWEDFRGEIDRSAAQLQTEGAASFVKSWTELMQRIKDKSAALATT